MFKKIARKKNQLKYQESTIKPNVDLAIDTLADYQNVFEKATDSGYLGLKDAFEQKLTVRLLTLNAEEVQEEIVGAISHYDEQFSQLVVMSGNTLKRLTFDRILEVKELDGGTAHEIFKELTD